MIIILTNYASYPKHRTPSATGPKRTFPSLCGSKAFPDSATKLTEAPSP